MLPERVVKLMLTAPLPPVCAPCTAVVTATASTASLRGVIDAKNESDERRKLSLLLTPSSVMLTNDSGRPLMRDSRLVVAVLTWSGATLAADATALARVELQPAGRLCARGPSGPARLAFSYAGQALPGKLILVVLGIELFVLRDNIPQDRF